MLLVDFLRDWKLTNSASLLTQVTYIMYLLLSPRSNRKNSFERCTPVVYKRRLPEFQRGNNNNLGEIMVENNTMFFCDISLLTFRKPQLYNIKTYKGYVEVSEPKWVNPDNISYGVNSFRIGGLHINVSFQKPLSNLLQIIFFW